MNAPDVLSDRLRWAIEGGCHQVDAVLIASLAESIRGGGLPWFVTEFAAAISDDALTPRLWGQLTHTDLGNDDYAQTDEELRYVWSQVAPDQPFPGKDTPAALSGRLRDVIAAHCHHLDPQLVEDLASALNSGGAPWFLDEFAAAIRAGQLTPTVWAELTETDLAPDELAETDKQLRYVWSQLAPSRPYPTDGPAR